MRTQRPLREATPEDIELFCHVQPHAWRGSSRMPRIVTGFVRKSIGRAGKMSSGEVRRAPSPLATLSRPAPASRGGPPGPAAAPGPGAPHRRALMWTRSESKSMPLSFMNENLFDGASRSSHIGIDTFTSLLARVVVGQDAQRVELGRRASSSGSSRDAAPARRLCAISISGCCPANRARASANCCSAFSVGVNWVWTWR